MGLGKALISCHNKYLLDWTGLIFLTEANRIYYAELTEFSGLGPISSQDAGNVRTTDAAVTFRQNDAEPFYEEITSQDNNGKDMENRKLKLLRELSKI